MEVNEIDKRRKMMRAKKRVEDLKGFYWHLVSYLFVNIMISTVIIVKSLGDGASFIDALFNFGTFAVWFFWGIGVFFHGAHVFSVPSLFGKNWEKRQIQKYIDRERQEVSKYQ